jgi:hypothetical protein
MTGLSRLIAREAAASLAGRIRDLGCGTVCDVGGGEGFLLTEVARKCPGVHYILFDLPDVVNLRVGKLEPLDVSPVRGSFFESVPRADAHILSNVIHDWPDDEALQILRNVRRAQGDSARLFLLEMMLGGEAEPLLARSTDLNMLVLTGGRERSEGEFVSLLSGAGYALHQARAIGDYTCLIEAVPVGLSR